MTTQRSNQLDPSRALLMDPASALHLVQALHYELDLQQLLIHLFGQFNNLTGAHGMIFEAAQRDVQSITLGHASGHHASYRLDYEQDPLGVLNVYFPRRATQHDLEACEELVALGFTALRNAILIGQARNNQALALQAPTPSSTRHDALILLELDQLQQLRNTYGTDWTQTVMTSVQDQLSGGLRQADGVYQISDDQIAVLLPNTAEDKILSVAAKIRVLVSSLHLSAGLEEQLTVSMGISDARDGAAPATVMNKARQALHDAQTQGRNETVVYRERATVALGNFG